MPKLRLLAAAFICVLALSSHAATKVEAVPEGTAIGTVFIDLDEISEKAGGPGVTIFSGAGKEVVADLRTMGFEVVSFQGARPKEARYLLTFSTKWKIRPGVATYIDDFRASLIDGKRVIGTVHYEAPVRRDGEVQKNEDVIGPLLVALFENVKRSGSVFPAMSDREIPAPDPSAALLTFDLYRANGVNSALKGTRFPVQLKDLIVRLGGKDGACRVAAETWDSDGRIYGTVEYALSDIKSPRGYFYVLCLVDGKPTKNETDKVLAAFLMFNFHEYRFAYSEKPVFSVKPKSKPAAGEEKVGSE